MLLMKVLTKRATRLWRLGLVREVATCLLSGTSGLSFRIFLAARWGCASETAAVLVVCLLAERQDGISVKWGSRDMMKTR